MVSIEGLALHYKQVDNILILFNLAISAKNVNNLKNCKYLAVEDRGQFQKFPQFLYLVVGYSLLDFPNKRLHKRILVFLDAVEVEYKVVAAVEEVERITYTMRLM